MRLRTALPVALLALAMMAGTASATTSTHDQNPDLRITVSLLPTNAHAGDTVVGTILVTNTTKHRLNVEVDSDFEYPNGGEGSAAFGSVGPGETFTQKFHRKVTATSPKGPFMLMSKAFDRNGASHARAHAVSS